MQGAPSTFKASSPSEIDHRTRLLEAIALAVAEKGYAQATIADIARRARVSKRTFYEHFGDKEECFLAAYAVANDIAFERVSSAAHAETGPEARLDAAVRAYVSALEEHPAMTRVFLMEIQAAGPKALLLRRAILGRYADLLRSLVDLGRRERPELSPLSASMATAVVGGINELLLLTVEQGGVRFTQVGAIARDLIRAAVLSGSAASGKPQGKKHPRSP